MEFHNRFLFIYLFIKENVRLARRQIDLLNKIVYISVSFHNIVT